MLLIERAGRIDEVAALGDGHRDDADLRVGKCLDNRFGVADRQDVDHRPGNAGTCSVIVLLDDRRQEILIGEFLGA